MKSSSAFTLMDLVIAIAVTVVLMGLSMLVNSCTKKSTPFHEHISDNHGIACSANATNRRFCKELGVE